MSDADVVAEYNLRLAQESEDLRLDPKTVDDGVHALLRDPAKGLYFLAEIDGEVAGQVMITYEWSDWRNGNIWWLQSVYVQQKFRRRGVFRAMFRYVEAQARNGQEVCCIRLYVHGENAIAQRTYELLGMKRTHYHVLELELS